MKTLREFIESGSESVCNDAFNLWVIVDGITLTIPTSAICVEKYTFEASEILEADQKHWAWYILYGQYVAFLKLK